MNVRICVGSSCHLKGAEKIVTLLQFAVAEARLGDEVTLGGSFCLGQCNRVGVTIQVEDAVYPGITEESFPEFFQEHIINQFKH